MKRHLLVAVLTAAVVLTAAPASARGFHRPERKLVGFVNAARADHGLRPLEIGWRINDTAYIHARTMEQSRSVFHGFYGFPWRRAWAQDVGTAATPWSVFRAFMRSPAHRHAILGHYRRIGVGAALSPGAVWVVLDFAA